MLDERWSEDVEEVGEALRRMLAAESNPARVRRAEATDNGRDPALESQLAEFGLNELEAPPEMFARVAFELGRSLATTAYVETIPALALLGRSGIALAFDRPVPAGAELVAVRRDDGVYAEALNGTARRTAAGDFLVEHHPQGPLAGQAERLGGIDLAERLERYAALAEAAKLVGAGQALLAYAVDYAGERKQFDRIIATYQGVSHKLAWVAGELDAAELLMRKAAFSALPEAGGDGAPQRIFAVMARVKAIEAARAVATIVHQTFGGNGFAMEYDVQLFSRRLRSWAMRGDRPGPSLAEIGRLMLDPQQRDNVRLLWHHTLGVPLPGWAMEADRLATGRQSIASEKQKPVSSF